MNKGFKLIVLATNWGFEGSLDAYCAKAKKDGYDGIEIWWPLTTESQDELFTTLKKYDLVVGFLCGDGSAEPETNLANFKKMVQAAATQRRQQPLYINCHSGKDFFDFDHNTKFIEYTNGVAKETGITICHETHRSRIMFAAPVALKYLEHFPDLKFTFDVSHWCNVHESLLADQAGTLQKVLERVEHIHARIGHAEGPQVNDPAAPEWKDAVNAHFAWWDKVYERKKQKGEVMTFLTEFGPPTYMPTLPYTQQPLSDLWQVNVYMMKLLRERYL